MSINDNQEILPYDYLKGREFTENLKRVLSCRNLEELSEILSIPKSTFTTWNAHDRTSHELMVRLHLALGIPVEELALKLEDKARLDFSKKHIAWTRNNTKPLIFDKPACDTVKEHAETHTISTFCLSNGKLIDTGWIAYPKRRFNSYNLRPNKTIELETNTAHYLVDVDETDPVTGDYLISIDERHSLNHIQRLPGKKLAVVFGDSTVEISEEDIKVIGRVAVSLEKK
ncbi:helix-turn-helix domain-containing protein [Vibrio sp. Vb2110]|uniref:helix-turn-helix domain-containing protein n=1 Tax=Vibrio TaxID=662 RepID=UPI001BD22DDE|nr:MULTISPECIES: helix-turn-helix domain-containing protein [Vibrio]MBS9988267.1 helix-turn-helix domain-containing protein [Vibrio alginolyticus]MDW1846172.1 helix-turn-helix domain-containing protein [Vibrio sp. Vb2130]MDW1880432.1 helix-turn-helix domain-containing protein [Vibrio sp. Vb2110]MDW2036477.1 helix-turn-helix domain-containing protein [Vibrio sp. 2130-1]MDW2133693.1 helix-turn-helix domain-containing protein [Vibrio sp. 2128(2023)]